MQFDICSSSMIMQELIALKKIDAWLDLLSWIQGYLNEASAQFLFRPFKFTGDGWILLFRYDPKDDLVLFADEFSQKFSMKIDRLVKEYLSAVPNITGVTFGVDRGDLINVSGIMGFWDYVGWPLNVVARLVKARNGDTSPQYKMLMTKGVYRILKQHLVDYPVKHVARKLKNIAGDKKFHCVQVRIKDL